MAIAIKFGMEKFHLVVFAVAFLLCKGVRSARFACVVRGQRDMFLFWHTENNCVSKGGEEQFGARMRQPWGAAGAIMAAARCAARSFFLKRKKRNKNSLTFRMPMSSYGGEDMSKGLPYSRHPFGSGAMVGSFGSVATINGKVTDLAGSAASAFAWHVACIEMHNISDSQGDRKW